MPKRKRDVTSVDPDGGSTKVSQAQRFKMNKKIKQGQRILKRALKRARRFEHQRLGKRIMRANIEKDQEKVVRLECELDLLKVGDLFGY